MSNSILLNPKHWRDRAEKTRAKADVILRDDLKKRLLRVAEEYERLARARSTGLRSRRAIYLSDRSRELDALR